jgi:hypothetical protein
VSKLKTFQKQKLAHIPTNRNVTFPSKPQLNPDLYLGCFKCKNYRNGIAPRCSPIIYFTRTFGRRCLVTNTRTLVHELLAVTLLSLSLALRNLIRTPNQMEHVLVRTLTRLQFLQRMKYWKMNTVLCLKKYAVWKVEVKLHIFMISVKLNWVVNFMVT